MKTKLFLGQHLHFVLSSYELCVKKEIFGLTSEPKVFCSFLNASNALWRRKAIIAHTKMCCIKNENIQNDKSLTNTKYSGLKYMHMHRCNLNYTKLRSQVHIGIPKNNNQVKRFVYFYCTQKQPSIFIKDLLIQYNNLSNLQEFNNEFI